MKLIPHHQDEYRSPDGAWRVVRTRRPGGSRNARPRWEVHERCEGSGAGWRHHAAFERRRDALVFLDTTAAASGGESVTTAPARRRETPEPSQEPPQSSPRRTPKGPITQQRGKRDGGRPAPPETSSCRSANGGSPGVRPRERPDSVGSGPQARPGC